MPSFLLTPATPARLGRVLRTAALPKPNRLGAAQAAVRKFVETQGDDTKIGLVLFSGFAQLAVAPTTNKADLLNTLDAVTTGRGTTIGAAILKSIDAIAELDPNVAPSDPEDASNSDGSSSPNSPVRMRIACSIE